MAKIQLICYFKEQKVYNFYEKVDFVPGRWMDVIIGQFLFTIDSDIQFFIEEDNMEDSYYIIEGVCLWTDGNKSNMPEAKDLIEAGWTELI